jgi:branched-chain amino acid aminotransferase
MKVYIDGMYHEKEDAKISVFDHGLLYGDGVFEGIRIYAGRAFKLHEHMRRLFASAHAIMLEIPHTLPELEKITEDAVQKNGITDGYIRLVVTRGVGDLGVSPYKCPRASVIVIVGGIEIYPREMYEKGIPVITAASRRIGAEVFDTRIKSLNYLNNVLARIEAAQAGCMEAVLLDARGYVSECTADNIFIVKNGALLTPSPAHGALEGITRATVLELAASLEVPAAEATLTRYDLYMADECFLTGTGAEIMPVTKVDGRIVGSGKPGKVTLVLRQAFSGMVEKARP